MRCPKFLRPRIAECISVLHRFPLLVLCPKFCPKMNWPVFEECLAFLSHLLFCGDALLYLFLFTRNFTRKYLLLFSEPFCWKIYRVNRRAVHPPIPPLARPEIKVDHKMRCGPPKEWSKVKVQSPPEIKVDNKIGCWRPGRMAESEGASHTSPQLPT